MSHLSNSDRSAKRKLEDFDSLSGDVSDVAVTRLRKISNKGKSPFYQHSPDRNFVVGESSRQNHNHDDDDDDDNSVAKLNLQFFVKMITGGKTLVLRANFTDTVEMIHRKIESITGINVMEQRLIYGGKQLLWEKTLEQCSVEKDASLELVGRMRSTDHPRAWRVINDMVSYICRICRKEVPNFSSRIVKDKLEQYMALRLIKPPKRVFWKKINNKKKKLDNNNNNNDGDGDGDDDDDDDEGDDDGYEDDLFVNGDNVRQTHHCKIFMDACAPQALVMLYVSSDNGNQECANDCIRSFVSSIADLKGDRNEKACCAAIVLEFCRLLRVSVDPDNLLFLHCRSTLGLMLEKIELGTGLKGMYTEEGNCVTIQDVFPLLKELGLKLVNGLGLSFKSDNFLGPSPRDVCDFSSFLKPVLRFIRKRHILEGEIHLSKGRFDPIGGEVDHMFGLFIELFSWIHKCLNQIDEALCSKKKKDDEFMHGGLPEYLPILKDMNSISVLYPGCEDQFWTLMIQYKAAVNRLIVRFSKHTDDYSWLFKRKGVLDFESRKHLAMLMFPEVREDYEEVQEMLIDRSMLLAESFTYITSAEPASLHAGLFMEFKNEEATGPGVLREWFCLVCQAIFDPQNALFVPCPLDRRRFFPNPASKIDPLHLKYFRFSGRVIALALMNKIQVGVVLDRVFFLQLAGRHVTMEDIQDTDPCIYNSCKQILEMDAEFVDSDGLGLTFVTDVEELGSRKVVELCAGGKEIAVNSKNRKRYVNLIVQHHFVKSIAGQVSSFARGFSEILRDVKLKETFFESLEPEDLDWMLYGSGSEICVDDWKAHTEYHGYKISDPQIVWFWEVLGQLTAEQKKTLLFFWTSVKYLPVEGFHGLASHLFIYKSLEPQDRLPSSHTCFYRLCVPPYPSKAIMQERLLVITQEHVGCSFGTW